MSETRPADQDRDQDRDREQLPVPVTQRVNPRLVFSDPDAFFLDLLLEQSEQG